LKLDHEHLVGTAEPVIGVGTRSGHTATVPSDTRGVGGDHEFISIGHEAIFKDLRTRSGVQAIRADIAEGSTELGTSYMLAVDHRG
jgi:hypothetical protein